MPNSTKLFTTSLIALALILGANNISAQETPLMDITEAIELDENIQASAFGLKEQKVLPDSPFYFLKEFGRGIRSVFTFDSVKKAELRSKFADEKLIEVKKMIEGKKNAEIIKKGLKNYKEEIDRIKNQSEKIKEKAGENPKIGVFLDKFTKHQILHQKLLKKIENQVPSQVFEKIKEARERHLLKFGEVITRFEDKPKMMQERLEKNMEEMKGSKFKNFKNLEILKEMEEKFPEKTKKVIRKIQENVMNKLQVDLKKMSSDNQEKFKNYTEEISGEKKTHLEILENLGVKLRTNSKIQQKIIQSKDKILQRIKQKETKEADVCIASWDPVCGVDGKTYSNGCYAKLAGVEINHKGACKK